MKSLIKPYDLAFYGGLFAISIAHILSWADFPPDVDPINFITSLENFDPTTDSPHPPGYPLLVFLAKIASLIFGDNHAFQAINLALLLGTGICINEIFKQYKCPPVGFAAAALFISHPIAWSATTVPESYICDAFFACLILKITLDNDIKNKTLLVLTAAIFVFIGLVRPVSGALLLPLGLTSIYFTRKSVRFSIIFIIVASVALVLAYAFTVSISGGYDAYTKATERVMGQAFKGASLLGGATLTAHLTMLFKFTAWLLFLSLPTILIISCAALKSGHSKLTEFPATAMIIGTAWMLPPLLLYILIYYLKPTYHLIYLPCLLIPIAWILFGSSHFFSFRAALTILGIVILYHFGLFFLPNHKFPEPIFKQSHAFIRQQDKAWDYLIKEIGNAVENDTLLVWGNHPTLSIYATRLLNSNGIVAFFNKKNNTLQYLNPKSMAWNNDQSTALLTNNKFTQIIFVDQENDAVKITRFKLTGDASRQPTEVVKMLIQ